MGGGLFSQGPSTVTNCTFLFNGALGGAGNSPGPGSSYDVNTGEGGAIANYDTQLTVMDSTLANNQAVGGAGVPGQDGGDGRGGGIANIYYGALNLVDSRLIANQALGASGADGSNGGNGLGGGLYNEAYAQTALMGTQIVNNQAIGGTADSGGTDGSGLGGGVYNAQGGVVTADPDTIITGNHASTADDDISGDIEPPPRPPAGQPLGPSRNEPVRDGCHRKPGLRQPERTLAKMGRNSWRAGGREPPEEDPSEAHAGSCTRLAVISLRL
jgi:hypothetical protein